MENGKKKLIPTIIAVVTLVLLVFGATYAYFTIGNTNNFGTKELNATLEDMASSVVLEQVENTLSLDVTRAMMSEDNAATTYYASGSSTPANIAKISVAGEGTYKCDYKITVTKSASSPENDLYEAIKNNGGYADMELLLIEELYDFGEEDLFPLTYEHTIYNITEKNPRYIVSNLFINNSMWDEQNYLKGKDLTLTYSISDFECELWEPTGEFTELTFNYEFVTDIGYYWSFDYEHGAPMLSSDNIVIPETFLGIDGVSYRVTAIGDWTEGLPLWNVENIQLPNSVKRISDWAFGMLGAETLKLPKQVESVGESIISDGYVEKLYLPKSLNDILAGALMGAYELKDVYYEGTEAEWNALFEDYVGEDKEFDSVIYYLYYVNGEELEENGYSIPTIHFNVNY